MDTTLFTGKAQELGNAAPTEIQVIPYGYHDTPKGPFMCDEMSAALVVEKFNGQKNDMVLDYEHQTLAGTEAPAAGWIKELVNKGKEGIWGIIEWTDRGKTYVKNKEYRYVSPVFLKRVSDNRVVKLINVALTNQPNIDGMVPIMNKAAGIPPSGVFTQTKKKETAMNEILKALGLPPDATEAMAVEEIGKLKAAPAQVANKAVLDALGLPATAAEFEVVGTVMAMKQGHVATEALSAKLAVLEKSLRERDSAELVANAMKEGKVSAANKEWALGYAAKDADGFKVFVAKAPVVIPMGAMPGGVTAPVGGMDDTQVQVNKMLGISLEAFKKHNN